MAAPPPGPALRRSPPPSPRDAVGRHSVRRRREPQYTANRGRGAGLCADDRSRARGARAKDAPRGPQRRGTHGRSRNGNLSSATTA